MPALPHHVPPGVAAAALSALAGVSALLAYDKRAWPAWLRVDCAVFATALYATAAWLLAWVDAEVLMELLAYATGFVAASLVGLVQPRGTGEHDPGSDG